MKTVVNERTITVKGIGKVKTKPDLIAITMELTTTGRDYTKTMELAALELETIRRALVSAGHKKQAFKTTDFDIDTETERHKDKAGNWRETFRGYSCKHDLKLEFDLDMKRLDKTLAAISASGVKPRFQIAFSVKDKNAVEADLLEKAVANAAEKAAILARAGGVSLGVIKHVNYSWGELHLYSNTHLLHEQSLMCAAPSMEIESEDITVNDSVTVIWGIK